VLPAGCRPMQQESSGVIPSSSWYDTACHKSIIYQKIYVYYD